jgi:signal transduction histidine kinase
MFRKIRKRLTVLYTGVMAVFLVAFIAVSDIGVLWLLYDEEKQDILSFAEEEAKEVLPKFKPNLSGREPKLPSSDTAGEKIFSYAFNKDGQLVDAQEPEPKMRDRVQKIILDWQDADGQGKIKKVLLPNGERAILIMCSKEIREQGEYLGRIYVGEDVTNYYQLLKDLLLVLIVISIFFIIIAALLGYMLAGRAIIPIMQSFARQRQFVADASHELRTPLSILLTSVEAVETDETNKLSSFSGQVLDDMKSEVRRMSKIVTDLLTLARADDGAANIIKVHFDVYTVIQQVIRSCQLAAEEKGLQLTFSGSETTIFADRERINQLLLILVDNAIKYTPPGGRVYAAVRMTGGVKAGINLIVEDSGIGIPDEHKAQIFDRFYRVDKARSREEGGSGLGLSIAKWIADAHGGTIKVENAAGGGSKFIVELPER